jgi:hypothetical protein
MVEMRDALQAVLEQLVTRPSATIAELSLVRADVTAERGVPRPTPAALTTELAAAASGVPAAT